MGAEEQQLTAGSCWSQKQPSMGRVWQERGWSSPYKPHCSVINNILQGLLPSFSAISYVWIAAVIAATNPAIEWTENFILHAGKVSSLCWAMQSGGRGRQGKTKVKVFKKSKTLAMVSFPAGWGGGRGRGKFGFEHIRCCRAVRATQGRMENSALHFWKLALPVLLGDSNQRWQDSVMKGEFRSTIKAAVRGPKNRELKVGAVFFFSML